MDSCLLLSIFLFISGCAQAQPVLNGNAVNPIPGDALTYHVTNYVNPGPAGANQFWDLSAMAENSTQICSFTHISVTPDSSSFSATSNVADKINIGAYYNYFNASSSALQFTGSNSNGTTIAYSDFEDLLRYPFGYTDSYTDYFSGSYVKTSPTGTLMVTRTGTCTVTYDGYGTLVIPNGTYTNVVRAHMIQDYFDNAAYFHQEDYTWYVAGHHMQLAALTTYSGQATGSAGFYTDYGLTGMQGPPLPVLKAHLFPNPASGNIYILLPVNISITEANIYSMDGRLVQSISSEGIQIDKGHFTINTAQLEPGIYFMKLISDDALIETKKLVISEQ